MNFAQQATDAMALLVSIRQHIEQATPEAERFLRDAARQIGESSQPPSPCAVDALLEITRFLLLIGRNEDTLSPATVALAQARELGDPLRLCKTLRAHCWVMDELGRYDDAVRSGAEAVALAERIGHVPAIAAGWNILGCALLQIGQFGLSATCYRRCLDLDATVEDTESYQHHAAANLFTNKSMQGDTSEAASIARALAEKLQREPVGDSLVKRDERACLHLTIADALTSVGALEDAAGQISIAKGLVDSRLHSRAARYLELSAALMAIARGKRVSIDSIAASYRTDHTTLHSAVAVYESVGQFDTALELLRCLNHEAKARHMSKFVLQERISEQGLALHASVASELSNQPLVRLELKVIERLDSLVEMAVNASTAAGHNLARVFRMAKLATLAAQSAQWPAESVNQIGLAAKLCDIGMIAIEGRILSKRGLLSAGETLLVAEHTRFGAELIAAARLDVLSSCVPVARFHHERWDGSGPNGLKGLDIPVEARLIAVCDAFDSMTHERPWRLALSVDEALEQIRTTMGSAFDADLSTSFVRMIQRERNMHADFDAYLAEEASETECVRLRNRVAALVEGSGRITS